MKLGLVGKIKTFTPLWHSTGYGYSSFLIRAPLNAGPFCGDQWLGARHCGQQGGINISWDTFRAKLKIGFSSIIFLICVM
jgi:hypothetical protein